MSEPRFVFSAVRRGTGPRGDAVHWRLLSGNNRQLGRSSTLYADEGSARAAAIQLIEELDVSEHLVVRLTGPTRWVWSIWQDRTVLAVSGRSFEMERAATRGLDRFIESAVLAPGLAERQLAQ